MKNLSCLLFTFIVSISAFSQSILLLPNGEIKSTLLSGGGNKVIQANENGILKNSHSNDFLILSAADFKPMNQSDPMYTNLSYGIGFTAGNYTFNASVHLPNGVKITNFRMYGYDNDSNANLSCFLFEKSPINIGLHDTTVLKGLEFTDNLPNLRYIEGNLSEIIDNENHFYFVSCGSSNWSNKILMRAVRISYSY